MEEARRHFLDALELIEVLGDPFVVCARLGGIAAIAVAEGRAEAAAALLAAADRQREAIGASHSALVHASHERGRAAADAALGADRAEAARARGRGLSLAAAVAEARREALRGAGAGVAGLTTRELDVLPLLASGMSDSAIAAELVVSVRTVHAHLRSIYRKLGVASRSAATRFAIERRLV